MFTRISQRTSIGARLLLVCSLVVICFTVPAMPARAASSGLLISEFLANPAGNDSPFEYVELLATQSIDFTTTPYSVIFSDNGIPTADGWLAGGIVTYGFNITTGSVKAGDVVYVGGSSMKPTGPKLRTINTATTKGDRFGNPNLKGVLGNGNTADAIGVFAADINTLTTDTQPVDAILFGTTIGVTLVNGGAAGYTLPDNDHYTGGHVQANSFLAPDPGSGQAINAAGVYDPSSGTFTTPRTWTAGVPSDTTTSITIAEVVVNKSIAVTCPAALFTTPGTAASTVISATDPDGIVGAPQLTSSPVSGITLDNPVAASSTGGSATATLNVSASLAAGTYNTTISFANDSTPPETATCTIVVGAVVLKPAVYLPFVTKP